LQTTEVIDHPSIMDTASTVSGNLKQPFFRTTFNQEQMPWTSIQSKPTKIPPKTSQKIK
jgi:hypothetical protein